MIVSTPSVARSVGEDRRGSRSRSITFEGIAVVGRDLRILGLVLLLILAILPG